VKPFAVPEHWSPEEALRIVALLEELIGAIWDVHGYAMGTRLQQHYEALDAAEDALCSDDVRDRSS